MSTKLHVTPDGHVVMTTVLGDGRTARVCGARAPRGVERDRLVREVASEMQKLRAWNALPHGARP